MIAAEFKILLIQILLLVFYTFLLKQGVRRNVLVFALACVAGFVAQLPLGRDLNRYTPNITVYFGPVSLAVILTWGIGLSAVHAMHRWFAALLGWKPSLAVYYTCGVPIVMILEFTGSNIVRMKLYNFREYTPLMGSLNAMHAPVWLYAYYILGATLFYFAMSALGLSETAAEPDAAAVALPVREDASAD